MKRSTTCVVRLREGVELLAKAGIDRTLLRNQMILTPACGCTGLTVDQAAKAYRLLSDLDVGAKEGLV